MKKRRQHERLNISLPIRLETLTSGRKEFFDLETKDISAFGTFITSPISFPDGTRFILDFKIPSDNIKEHTAAESLKGFTGKMVRSTPQGMAILFDKECPIESLKAL